MSAFEPFEIEKSKFSSLLQSRFIVPDLQRPFAWRKDEAQDLIRDILALVDALSDPDRRRNPQHYIGTIVTIQAVGRLRVIDGQQRLTTTTTLLGLVKTSLTDIKERLEGQIASNPQASGLLDRVSTLVQSLDGLLWHQGFTHKEVRFKPSPEIEKTYESLISGGDGRIDSETRKPAQNLRKIAQLMRKELVNEKSRFRDQEDVGKVNHLQTVYEAVANCLIFVHVSTASSSAGYQLFESLNATGRPLNALDLLKVWMMAKVEDHPLGANVADQFRQLTNDDADTARDYLIDYFRSRTASNVGRKPTGKELSCIVRGKLFRDPHVPSEFLVPDASNEGLVERIADHVACLYDWQGNWEMIRKGVFPFESGFTAFDQERLSLLVRDPLKHSLPIPLLMQGAVHLSPTDFAKLVHLIERVFFRYKTICNGAVGPLEEIYQWGTRVLDTNAALDLELFAQKLDVLITDEAPDQIFEAQLANKLTYDKGSSRVRYFLATLDLYEGNPPPTRVPFLDLEWSIEHVAPQSPIGSPSISDDRLHSLGNLCLLTPRENAALGNKTFTEKKEYGDNNAYFSKLTREVFMNHSKWEDAEVDSRQVLLFNRALKVFTAKVY